ncbi:hypothetical protein [Streptacidiphilus sp. PAMC 29251]
MGAPAFEAFLAEHAAALSPTASAYLGGLAQAGTGPEPIARRHRAAMQALLALLDADSQAIVLCLAEIGPPPVGGFAALLDSAVLLDQVRFYAPRGEDRPSGATDGQLADARRRICTGLDALALASLRDIIHPDRVKDCDDIEEAAKAVVRRWSVFPNPVPGPTDDLLPAVRFTVSFRITDDPDTEADVLFDPSLPDRACLCLWVTDEWGAKVAATGHAELAGRPVTQILQCDKEGRPLVARIIDLTAFPDVHHTPDPELSWELHARNAIVNVDWTDGTPRLFMPSLDR